MFLFALKLSQKKYTKTEPTSAKVIIKLDEMWHFLGSKKDKFESGKLTVEQLSGLLIGGEAQEAQRLLQKCTVS